MMTVEWQDERLKQVIAKGGKLADAVLAGCVKRSHNYWAEKMAHDAQTMVPVQLGILLNSQQVKKTRYGFTISYGGKASEYAYYQHEGTNLQHHPPSNKWTYEGGGAGDRPGAWNPPRGSGIIGTMVSSLASQKSRAIWTQGGKQVSRGKGWWRYEHVKYGRRSLRSSHPQNPGATHHWLHGRPHSAAERNLAGLSRDLTNVGVNIIEELLGAA